MRILILILITIDFSVLKGKRKLGRRKDGNNEKEFMLKMLIDERIPFLESALYGKQRECNELRVLISSRDDIIAQKTKVSMMKDEQLKKLRTENSQLKNQIDELRGSLQKSKFQL